MNTKARCIRRRTYNQGSEPHPRKVTIRVTECMSNRVASLQGLMYKYGRRETLSELFEKVMFPALQEYVKPYAERAKADRAKKEVAS